jgi:hypothetical protein
LIAFFVSALQLARVIVVGADRRAAPIDSVFLLALFACVGAARRSAPPTVTFFANHGGIKILIKCVLKLMDFIRSASFLCNFAV